MPVTNPPTHPCGISSLPQMAGPCEGVGRFVVTACPSVYAWEQNCLEKAHAMAEQKKNSSRIGELSTLGAQTHTKKLVSYLSDGRSFSLCVPTQEKQEQLLPSNGDIVMAP